jgi:hypothetical protein
VTAAKKLARKSIRLVKFSSRLELPFKLPAAGDPEHLQLSCAKWAFLVLVLAYPPRPGTQNCSQLFQLIALSDHMSTREKLIAEADYSSASALVIFEAMAEETSVSALRHG